MTNSVTGCDVGRLGCTSPCLPLWGGVGGCGRQLFGREIIDRNGGGDRLRRGMQLRGLGIIDQRLPFRLVDVAHVRAAHALAQRLGRGDEREGALEPRHPVVADAVEDIDGEALARGRGVEQDVGAGLRQPVGRTATARAERQRQKAQKPRRRPVGKVREDLVEPAPRWWRSRSACTTPPAADPPPGGPRPRNA